MNVNMNILRSQLENERKRLSEELEQLQASIRPANERREGSPFGKREEEATESFELEKKIALQKNLRDSLAEVEHALEKFEKGTYGMCDACSKPITPERLEARPHAALCVDCKAKLAKNTKGRSPMG